MNRFKKIDIVYEVSRGLQGNYSPVYAYPFEVGREEELLGSFSLSKERFRRKSKLENHVSREVLRLVSHVMTRREDSYSPFYFLSLRLLTRQKIMELSGYYE